MNLYEHATTLRNFSKARNIMIEYRHIADQLLKVAKRGKSELFVNDEISKEVLNDLENDGFSVEQQQQGYIIKW